MRGASSQHLQVRTCWEQVATDPKPHGHILPWLIPSSQNLASSSVTLLEMAPACPMLVFYPSGLTRRPKLGGI